MVKAFSRNLLVIAVALPLAGAACKKDEAPAAPAPAATPAAPAPKEKQKLMIWWAQWAPADGLQELASEWAAANDAEVKVHQIPWGSFQDQVFQEFGKNQTSFDVVVGDSQWLGRGATKNLYLDLSDWLPKAVDMKTLHPNAVKYLAEYPTGSGKYFAAPAETDAMGFAYRKDWFEDAKEKEAFKKKYRKDLAPPVTWDDLKQIAEFFTRPADKKFGLAMVTGRSYEEVIMGFEQVLYAFGGTWSKPGTQQVKGALDSADAVKGLDFFKGLLKFGPPGGSKLGYGEVLEPFTNGSTAMIFNYFAFYPTLSKQMGDKIGFFAMPKQGERRFATLGGQGFSISAKVKPEQQELAKKFIGWFLQTETQKKWVQKPGGFTANAQLLSSEDFKKATPYNEAFSQSMDILVDFWNVPVYNELIAATVQHLGEALDGKKSSKDALTALAAEHEKILSQQ
jgi:multiple sugar transport system substrate-binding protein